jgi:hypothetical protein
MKDTLEQEMIVGDCVIFHDDIWNSLRTGRVVNFTPKMVRVRVTPASRDSAGNLVEKSGTLMKDPRNLICVHDTSIHEMLLKKDI